MTPATSGAVEDTTLLKQSGEWRTSHESLLRGAEVALSRLLGPAAAALLGAALALPLEPLVGDESSGGTCGTGALEIAYVANEGFLLSAAGERVLVDALFRDGLGTYAVPEGDLRERLEGARGEFADVGVLLATHPHRDHFSAAAAAHLRANPAAILVGPAEAADSVRLVVAGAEGLLPRVRAVSPEEGGRQLVDVSGVRVEALGLPHGPSRRPVEHAGWLVHLGGRTVVHLGDAEVQRDRYRALSLSAEGVDVALVPYWALLDDEARAVVLEELRPRRVVAMHVDVGETAGVAARLRELAPGAWTPAASGERLCVD